VLDLRPTNPKVGRNSVSDLENYIWVS